MDIRPGFDGVSGQQPLTLAAIDLDGTLVDPLVGIVLDDDTRGLAAWVGAGRRLAIISARSPFAMFPVLEQLGTACFAAGFNGGIVWESSPTILSSGIDAPLFEMGLPFEASLRCWKRCLEMDVPVVWHGKYGSTATERSEVVSFVAEGEHVAYGREVRPSDPAFKITVIGGRPASGDIQRELLLEEDFAVYVTESGHIEATNARISKGTALAEVCKAADITEAHVIAIGDGDNDVPMFRRAGFSIAVPGASQAARNAASVAFDDDSSASVGSILSGILERGD